MSKKRVFRYLLFVILLVVADRIIGEAISTLSKKQIRDNRIGLLIENKIPAQIYILGSSRALNNYSPEVITAITGKTCYNLGVSGSNIIYHETILDLILTGDTKPEIIIYNIDDYGTLFFAENIIFRKDVLYPYIDNDLINKKVSEVLDRNVTATEICDSYRQNINFINALKYLAYGREVADYKTTNFDSLGSNLLVNRPEDKIPVFGQRNYVLPTHIPDTALAGSFYRIQEKCLNNNIHLILTLPPLYTTPSAYFRQEIKKRGIPGVYWLDFTHQMQQAGYFFNSDHMNKTGALLFSDKVGHAIKNIRN